MFAGLNGMLKPAHDAAQPERADRHRQQRQNHRADTAEVNEHQHGNRDQRIQRRLLVAALEQRRVFQQLHRRAGHIRIKRPQLADKFFLLLALPDVFLGINLEQMFSVDADEAIAQRRRQILHPQLFPVVLLLQRFERGAQIVEQRPLIVAKLGRPRPPDPRRCRATFLCAKPRWPDAGKSAGPSPPHLPSAPLPGPGRCSHSRSKDCGSTPERSPVDGPPRRIAGAPNPF